ncbi:hypothetical protein U1Q18_025641 [Sarracenia purpurea var. burkii]
MVDGMPLLCSSIQPAGYGLQQQSAWGHNSCAGGANDMCGAESDVDTIPAMFGKDNARGSDCARQLPVSWAKIVEEVEADTHHEVKGGPKIKKEVVPEASNYGPKESSMDEDEDKGDEGGSGDGEQDDGFSDSSGSDSVPEKGDCEQVEDANQGLGAIQVSLPDSSPACEAGVYTDSERRLSLALEDI